jgi:hypothetical protein
LIAGLVAAPLAWALLALGQDGSARTIGEWESANAFDTAELIVPAAYLAAVGVLLGLLATLRISPLGPLAAGVTLVTVYGLMFVNPFRVHDALPDWSFAGDPLRLAVPLDNGTLGMVGALLLMAVFSVQRWRRWPAPAPVPEAAEPAPEAPSADVVLPTGPATGRLLAPADAPPAPPSLASPEPAPAPVSVSAADSSDTSSSVASADSSATSSPSTPSPSSAAAPSASPSSATASSATASGEPVEPPPDWPPPAPAADSAPSADGVPAAPKASEPLSSTPIRRPSPAHASDESTPAADEAMPVRRRPAPRPRHPAGADGEAVNAKSPWAAPPTPANGRDTTTE